MSLLENGRQEPQQEHVAELAGWVAGYDKKEAAGETSDHFQVDKWEGT